MSVVVTGGASGIGAAAADRLRKAGHDVITWDLRGGDIDCDISDPDAVTAALEQTLTKVGAPDRLVACAAMGASGMLIAQDPADWKRVIDVNLTGTWLTMRAVAQAMSPPRRSHVMTSWPAPRSRSAAALPMPEAPPVTMAVTARARSAQPGRRPAP